jgi:hypothetical protein
VSKETDFDVCEGGWEEVDVKREEDVCERLGRKRGRGREGR